ncbi:hypothetical protein evm_000712 [Chilo suppressalis]|nr:hypothetical protein evm_000712 [Chilo suppressalis]
MNALRGISVPLYILIAVVQTSYVPAKFFYDNVKDGRPVDGPFPSSLTNVPYYCYQVPLKGTCNRVHMVWFFDIVKRKCMPMFYSGCGGNENRFMSKASCQLHCDHSKRI